MSQKLHYFSGLNGLNDYQARQISLNQFKTNIMKKCVKFAERFFIFSQLGFSQLSALVYSKENTIKLSLY